MRFPVFEIFVAVGLVFHTVLLLNSDQYILEGLSPLKEISDFSRRAVTLLTSSPTIADIDKSIQKALAALPQKECGSASCVAPASFVTIDACAFDHPQATTSSPRYTLAQQVAFFNRSRRVDGWSGELTFDVLQIIDSSQYSLGVSGKSVGEIGVHHGKSFLWVESVSRTREQSFALDVFDDQSKNIDKSGGIGATEARLWNNLAPVLVKGKGHVHVLKKASNEIQPCEFQDRGLTPVRLFSIDGGHTAEQTYLDMWFAASQLVRGGCMFVDDYANFAWMGVAEGAHRFMAENDNIAPIAVVAGKLWLCDASYAPQFRLALDKNLPARLKGAVKTRHTPGPRDPVIVRSRLYSSPVLGVQNS